MYRIFFDHEKYIPRSKYSAMLSFLQTAFSAILPTGKIGKMEKEEKLIKKEKLINKSIIDR